MVKTAYIWDNITVATRELEEYLNNGYEVVASTLYEAPELPDHQTMFMAAVLVKEGF